MAARTTKNPAPRRHSPTYPITDLGGAEATALIDTGSSLSGVSVSLAQSLGLIGLGKRPLKSAQGEGHVERYAFRLAVSPDQPYESSNFPFVFEEVIGIELTNAFEFSALIGMDILSQCDFSTRRDGDCSLVFG